MKTMTQPGWVSVNIHEAWTRWVDEYVKNNPHGLKSRAQVIEFALKLLRDGAPLATKRDVDDAVERLLRRLRDPKAK